MADRPKRERKSISDLADMSDVSGSDSEDTDLRKSDSARRTGRQDVTRSPKSASKRGGSSGSYAQTSPSNQDGKQSIKLTMKVAPSKLREVMRANEVDSLKDTLGGGQVLDGPRSRRSANSNPRVSSSRATRPKYVEPRESDSDDDEDEDDLEEDDDIEPDVTMNDFDEVGAEAEGGTDDDELADMEDDSPAPIPRTHQMPPKPPKIMIKTPAKGSKSGRPEIHVTPANVGPLQSVEDEEMDDAEDDDDEDLEDDSELPDDEDETNLNGEDAEGETELAQDIGMDDEELEELDDEGLSDSDDEGLASGTATPDPAKLTSRQRGKAVEPLMSLDMAPQQRKFFTEAEKAMKKDEHARKRKELTKRKTQEEKTAALNRLLKPQVNKSRGAAPKAETLAAQMQAAAEEEFVEQRANPLYTRWVSNKHGMVVAVPDEWLDKQVGQYLSKPSSPPSTGKLVQS